MSKELVEALGKMLPDKEAKELDTLVESIKEKIKAEFENEYNTKLEEAYAELSTELATSEKTAEAGYEEAYAIIADLRNRLELQGEEYKAAVEEGYEEAYEMLKLKEEEKQKLEVEMYEEYDKKLSEMKEYMVDKVDQFLQFKGHEIYEQAKRDVLNDPRMAEHKVTLDKIIDLTSNYLSDDDFSNVSSKKLEEVAKANEELKGQLKLMEARNIRISTENTKLNEAVRHAQEVITESKKFVVGEKKKETINEQKERTEKATKVTGRGSISEDTVVISEASAPTDKEFENMLVLSGLKKSN